jgi:hypothetical protein
MEHNPFAPPSAAAQGPDADGLVFSPEGAQVVAGLSRWMNVLGVFYYIGAAFFLIAAFFMLVVGSGIGGNALGGLGALLFGVFAIGIGIAAMWLRGAASDFQRGVLGDDETPIGQGFRSLRAYLILFGIIGILQLLMALAGAV